MGSGAWLAIAYAAMASLTAGMVRRVAVRDGLSRPRLAAVAGGIIWPFFWAYILYYIVCGFIGFIMERGRGR